VIIAIKLRAIVPCYGTREFFSSFIVDEQAGQCRESRFFIISFCALSILRIDNWAFRYSIRLPSDDVILADELCGFNAVGGLGVIAQKSRMDAARRSPIAAI